MELSAEGCRKGMVKQERSAETENVEMVQMAPPCTSSMELVAPINTMPAIGANYMGHGSMNRCYYDVPDRKLRVSPLTVKWLVENYETAAGVSLPRSVLYLHYMQHCAEQNLEPVNAASFGKLIRSVFLGLRTRRLGTRGNSKYHYYGIRIKTDSNVDESLLNTYSKMTSDQRNISNCAGNIGIHESVRLFKTMLRADISIIPDFPPIEVDGNNFNADEILTFKYFSERGVSYNAPNCLTFKHLCLHFYALYKLMYRRLLDTSILAIRNFDFVAFNRIWKDFWNTTELTNSETDMKMLLTRSKLVQLCSTKSALNFITFVDTKFYLNIVHKLMPEVVQCIPLPLIYLMTNFARNMESWMITSLVNCSDDLKQRKLEAVTIFRDSFLRYLSLNRLSFATGKVLSSQKYMVQMVTDFSRIDFEAIKREVVWTAQCDYKLIESFQHDFEMAFKNRFSLEQWAIWLRNLMTRSLPSQLTIHQFLIKWSFYSSIIIRELTLMAAPSFGPFVLLRTFFDQFFVFILEEEINQ